MTKSDLFNTLDSQKKQLKKYGVKRIGLFGSYVRNEQTEKSDLDFLVEFEKGKKNYDNFIHLSFFLEDLYHKKVDLLTHMSMSPYLKPYILSEVEYYEI